MSNETIELKNSVYWDHSADDKVYQDKVHIALEALPFAMRQVHLRFTEGPALDLSVYDMDRLVSAYLKLRGIKPPAKLNTPKEPAPCDFLVPNLHAKKR